VYLETLTGRPNDISVQKATSDNENVDAVKRHAQDAFSLLVLRMSCNLYVSYVLSQLTIPSSNI